MVVARKKPIISPKDRLSSLPDEILGQILSFLPTKYAVATSALSRRWRNLYKLSTNLDFDDSVSFKSQKGLTMVKRNTHFREFVDSILAGVKESNVTKFRLKCGKHNFDNSVISYWIKVGCSLKISELELSIYTRVPYSLPLQLSVSTCQNLVVLKLVSNFEVRIPNTVAFPWLKVLVFEEIRLVDCSLSEILVGCPLLEEFVSVGCDIHEGNLCITNPFLRSLILDDGTTGPLDQFHGSVYFNAPRLMYLMYSKALVDRYMIRNLDALVEAHIDICFNDDEFDEPQDLCDSMLDLVIGVSNCELLYLSGQCLEALTSGAFELPIFRKLTRLELGLGCDVSWNDIILVFLHCSPCLESLIFEEGLIICNTEEVEDFILNDEPVPSCVKSRLKSIEIKRFWGSREEIDLVMYFLENANVLEELVLRWEQRKRTKDIILKERKLSKLHKASNSCSICFR